MKGQKKSCLKKIITLVVIIVLFVAVEASVLEAAKCEDAFTRCLNDPIWGVHIAAFFTCIPGYLFCLKYIK